MKFITNKFQIKELIFVIHNAVSERSLKQTSNLTLPNKITSTRLNLIQFFIFLTNQQRKHPKKSLFFFFFTFFDQFSHQLNGS